MKFRRIGQELQEISNKESKLSPGLGIFTLREPFSEDYYATLKKVANMGYQTLELYGHEQIQADEMKKTLDSLGLKGVSLFVRSSDLEEELKEQINYALTIGAKYIATDAPEETFQDETKFEALVSLLRHAAKELQKHNLQLVYHAHAYELEKVNEQFVLDRLLKNVGPIMDLELDIYWIKKAGLNPKEILKRYKGRVPLIHVKDIDEQGDFKEVGYGILDWPAIFSAAQDVGVKYYFVEQDVTPHPLRSVKMSIDYLKKVGLV
jgi:sugar phosphate isomerase/epimerase